MRGLYFPILRVAPYRSRSWSPKEACSELTRRDAVRRNRLDSASRGKGGWYTGWRYMAVLGGIIIMGKRDICFVWMTGSKGHQQCSSADQQLHRIVPPTVPSFVLMRGGFFRRRASRRRNGCLLQQRAAGLAWLGWTWPPSLALCRRPLTYLGPNFSQKMQQICSHGPPFRRRAGGRVPFSILSRGRFGKRLAAMDGWGRARVDYARRACRP